jgi:chromosome segregation ATPase
LEGELVDEQESYEMLNETLVGQRRNLREREEILSKHQAVLWRRQGKAEGGKQDEKIDLGPVLSQLEAVRHQQGEELQKLEGQIQQMREAIGQMEGTIHRQTGEQEAKRYEIKQLEQNLQGQRGTVAELWGRVNLYQEMLQPIQDNLSQLRQKLEEIRGGLNQAQESGDSQTQAIASLQEILASLTKG